MSIAQTTFERFFPAAEELWDRADATYRVMQSGNDGDMVRVPDFSPDVIDINYAVDDEIFRRRGRAVGRTISMHALTTDGIDREMHLHLPLEHHGADFFVKDGAAWTTKNLGYAGRRAEDIVAKVGVPVLQIGGEHSTERLPVPLEFMRLGKTAMNAMNISQSYTAQVEELLTAYVVEEFGLPENQEIIGDSRAKMKQALHYPYATEYGTNIVYSDGKAPCVPEKLVARDIPKFLKWCGVELGGGAGIVAELVATGDLDMLLRTTSINPNFILSSIIAARALATGEASMTNRLPRLAHGVAVIYDRDGMSRASDWDEVYAEHPNYHVKHVQKGIHASLLTREANKLQIERTKRLSDEALIAGFHGVDYTYVRTGQYMQAQAA